MRPEIEARRRAIAPALLALCLLALGSPSIDEAVAQASAQGAFSISPSRRDLVGRPPATLVPTRVSNTTNGDYDVRVFPVLLRQDLSGAFVFDETPGPLRAARTILRVSRSRFRLAPGQSREVGLRWELLPLGARAAYVGVIFQGQRRLKNGGSVPVISRLLSINFFRLPRRYHANGVFRALHAIQLGPRVLRILPRVRNTGDIIGSPTHGRLAIHDSTGRTVYKTHWKGDVILPRAERDFPIDVRSILPAGRYTASATMTFGANHQAKVSTAFTLAGPNRLTAPGVKFTDFAAHGEVGRPAHVSGRVQSTGTAPAKLDLSLSLFRVTGGLKGPKPLVDRQLNFSGLAPGSMRSVDVDLSDGLASGDYRAVATYTDASGAPQQLTSDFAATRHRGLLDRLKLFYDRHMPLVIIVIALIVIAVLVFLLLRRQRRLESELRTARAQRDDSQA